MPKGAEYYDRVSAALNGINNQLNVNAQRDIMREEIGLRRLQDHQQTLMNMRRDERAQESHNLNMELSKERSQREIESHGWAKQQFQLSIPGLKFNNLKFNNAMEESTVNVGKWFSQTPMLADQLKNNTELQESIAGLFGDGAKLDPETFNVVDATGTPIKASGYDQALQGPMLVGILESHIDPQKALGTNKEMLSSKLNSLQKQHKKTDNWDIAKKAALSKDIARTKSELSKTNQNLTPMSLLQFYQRKSRMLSTASTIAAANMLPGSYINMLSNAQAQTSKAALEIQKQLFESQGAGSLKGGQRIAVQVDGSGKMVPGSSAVLTVPKERRGFFPDEIDSRLKDYVWADELKGINGSGEGYVGWKQAKYLDAARGKRDATGQWYVTKENQGRRTNDGILTTKYREKFPNEDPIKIAQTALAINNDLHNNTLSEIQMHVEDPDYNKAQRSVAIKAAKEKFKGVLEKQGLRYYDPAPKIK